MINKTKLKTLGFVEVEENSVPIKSDLAILALTPGVNTYEFRWTYSFYIDSNTSILTLQTSKYMKLSKELPINHFYFLTKKIRLYKDVEYMSHIGNEYVSFDVKLWGIKEFKTFITSVL